MFDLLALSLDFIFTAIITSVFKVAVKGKVRMLMIMTKISTAWVTEPEGSLPPSKTSKGYCLVCCQA